MKYLITLLTLIVTTVSLVAQVRYFDERYVSTLSYINPYIVNPAAAGMDESHDVFIAYKNKWLSFPDSPKSFLLSYDGKIFDNLGVGLLVNTDRNGALETNKVLGSLSYSIKSEKNIISVGFSGEYVDLGLSSSSATHRYIDIGDSVIGSRELGNSFFDVSVAAYGIYDNKLTYGISLPSIVSSRVENNTEDTAVREVGFIFNLGYKYESAVADATFEPSIFVKQLNNVPFHADVNLLGRFADDKFRGGVTFTVAGDKRVGFLLGTTFNVMSLNYTYNISRHQFQTYNNGMHEISLLFDIGKPYDRGEKPSDDMGGDMLIEKK